ncbi:MAG: ion transporter, partial [Actinobacteria bacterium]|nr:ion transporter [Actinomycetota bacterium]
MQIHPWRVPWLTRLVYSSQFELFIAFVILVNAVSLAILTMPDLDESVRAACEQIDLVCFVIYTVELVLRIISYGKRPWEFFKQGWNVFDFVVIAAAPFFAGQTAVLRILRLLRLFRIFRFLPEVRVLTTSIVRSLPPLMSLAVLIFVALFMYGMLGFYLFGESDPTNWGSITEAMTSLFILLTLENFPNYLETGVAISPWALPYFLSYVFVVVFTVLNVLIGVVLNAMDEAREENRERAKRMGQLSEIV